MHYHIAGTAAKGGPLTGIDQKLLNLLFRTSRDIFAIFGYQSPGRSGTLLRINDFACELLGYTRQELQNLFPSGFVAPETIAKLPAIRSRLMAGKTVREEIVLIAKNGEPIACDLTADMVLYQDRPVVIGICRNIADHRHLEDAWQDMLKGLETEVSQRTAQLMDINRQLQAESLERFSTEETLAEKEQQLRLLTDNMTDMVMQIGTTGVVSYVSPSCNALLGYEPSALVGKPVFKLIHPDDAAIAQANFNQTVTAGTTVNAQCRLRHAKGRWLWTEGVTRSIRDEHSAIVGVVACYRDITSRKRVEQQLKYQAVRDPITGLYNRTHFEIEMARLATTTGLQPVGLIISDIDGLKYINDTLGHDAGDELLANLAGLIRAVFTGNEVVARIGGDEFAVILSGAGEDTLAGARARIAASIAAYNAKTPTIPLCVSIGTAITGPQLGINGLFKEADNSMYREKLLSQSSSRHSVVQALKKALEARDFVTEGHATRLRDLTVRLAKVCGFPDYKLTDLCLLAEFHDIGKVGIPDHILFKPRTLTPAELKIMHGHAEIGHRIAVSTPDLEPIADWILKHHEWWNGQGYPLGLSGKKIPLECRILSIADAYDAMTNDRPYRLAMSREAALAEIKRCAGTQFDPELAEHFIKLLQSADGAF